jgi:HSP20 family protein
MAKEPEGKEGKEVTRWNPFRDDPFFSEGFLRDWASPFSRLVRGFEDLAPARGSRPSSPAVDLTEDESCYAITAELPGVRREDVNVEIQDDVLTLRGEKKSEREEKKGRSHWVERSYGAFCRSFTLPANAQGDALKATFKDGVLRIEIPKKEQAKTRQIAIQ